MTILPGALQPEEVDHAAGDKMRADPHRTHCQEDQEEEGDVGGRGDALRLVPSPSVTFIPSHLF